MTVELSVSIASNRATWTLTDDSTFTSPARSGVGVFVQAYKVDGSNNSTALSTTGNDEDPETDSSWEIEYTIDGHYKVHYVSIPDFNSSSTYARYDAVFQPSDNKVYRSKQNSNTTDTLTDTDWWEEITGTGIAGLAANKDTATESANIDSLVYERVLRANSSYEFANQMSDQTKFVDDDEIETLSDYNLFALWLDAAEVADTRTEVVDGELICRRIQKKFID